MPHPVNGYRIDGESVPGVTTILGRFKESGALLFWAFEQGKAAERGEIRSLYEKRDQAADAGTIAHAMVEAHIYGREYVMPLDTSIEVADKAHQGFENYLTWAKNSRLKITRQEVQMVSKKHRFGGCPDGIGYGVDFKRCLIDWKTSSKGPYVDWLLQLAAYSILWDENNPGSEINGGFHLCKFSNENADFAHFYWNDLIDAKEQFILLRKAYDLDKKLKKRV